jgi:hypothetical protein
VTANQFFDQLLLDIQVDDDELSDARDKRDALARLCCRVMGENLGGSCEHVAVGALAQGTQIQPLNDVDLAIVFSSKGNGWDEDPEKALRQTSDWIREGLRSSADFKVSSVEPSSHAVKIEFDDQTFSADVVPAFNPLLSTGLSIPHCPKNDPSDRRWIATDPARHRDMVKDRNRETSSKFARQIRILKWWNRYKKLQDQDERKPVSSFHLTALALSILDGPISHAEATAHFFEQASAKVLSPIPTPSGVGDPLEAEDPVYASELFERAAENTRKAIGTSDSEDILLAEFGDPKAQRELLSGASFSVGAGGALLPGIAGVRPHKNPRSHGDGR